MNEDTNAVGHSQAVLYYKDSRELCEIVANFLIEGFTRGQPALVIATPEHVTLIEERLSLASLDFASLKRLGELVIFDAREFLGSFMSDGTPNQGAFRHNVGGIIKQICRDRTECIVRAYAEMID